MRENIIRDYIMSFDIFREGFEIGGLSTVELDYEEAESFYKPYIDDGNFGRDYEASVRV